MAEKERFRRQTALKHFHCVQVPFSNGEALSRPLESLSTVMYYRDWEIRPTRSFFGQSSGKLQMSDASQGSFLFVRISPVKSPVQSASASAPILD